jgi:hypothetical protein
MQCHVQAPWCYIPEAANLMVVNGENNRSYEIEGKGTDRYIWRIVGEEDRAEIQTWHQTHKNFSFYH